jgi:hypothetical protein
VKIKPCSGIYVAERKAETDVGACFPHAGVPYPIKDLTTLPGHASSGCLAVVPIRPEHRDALMQYIRQYHVDTADSLRMLGDCLAQGYAGNLAMLDGEIIGYRWWVTHEMRHP